MRYLPDVIDQMLAVIPISEPGLLSGLAEVKESAQYAAPEMQLFWWRSCAQILNEELGETPPSDGWQGKVAAIWMDTNRSQA